MYGSSTFLAREVHSVSYAADVIEPFNTPIISWFVVMGPRGFGAFAMDVDVGGVFHNCPQQYLSQIFFAGEFGGYIDCFF